MAVAFVANGTVSSGTTSCTPGAPASLASGDLIVLYVGNKYPSNGPTTPTGFTLLVQQSGGNGSSGVDAGNVYATVYYKISDGTESGGSFTVAVTSGNAVTARASRYTKAAAASWDIAATSVAQNTPGVTWTATGAADPGVIAGDVMIAASVVNSDANTVTAATTSITQTGVTYGSLSERIDGVTASGDDIGLFVDEVTASSGTSSAAPVLAATMVPGTGTNDPAGATAFIRLRESNYGVLAVTNGADTLVATGTSTDNGVLAITEGADTVAATGTNTNNGVLAVTEGADSVAADGTSAGAPAPATGSPGDFAPDFGGKCFWDCPILPEWEVK